MSNDDGSNIKYYKTPADYSAYTTKTKSHNNIIIVGASIVLFGLLLFSIFYILPQDIPLEIDSETMLEKYLIGKLGSDHAHSAIVIFLFGTILDFSQDSFQLQNSYIHFENHNPYQIHRHATNVPLEVLFDSFDLEITEECIIISQSSFCGSKVQFFVNEEPYQNITSYIPEHKDRILISMGGGNITEQLEYLKSLPIHEPPTKDTSKNDELFI